MRNLELKKNLRLLAILFVSSLAFNACSDDDHDDHDHDDEDHEEINLMIYTLTDSENNSVIFTYSDPDGEGGADGTSTVVGQLTVNTTYAGAIQFLHVDGDETEDIGAKIAEEEGDEHEIFYTSTSLNINRNDNDENGNPLGFNTTVTASEAGMGSLTITLVHEGPKPNNGLEEALTTGVSDIQKTFEFTVTE